MRQTVAIRRIESFEKRFRKPHLYLAYHAAFPLALTPDLLYRLWANFQQDIHGELLNIPWEAVADLLLSSLCEEVGHELYEMDSAIRNELLRRLRTDEKFCNTNSKQDRILQLSDFLLEYVDRQLQSEDLDVRDFAEAQHWTALAYAKPGKAVEQIARAFSQLQEATASEFNSTDKTEILRLASLVETFAEPLAEAQLEPLLVYTRAMASFSRGDLEGATAQLSKIAEAGKLEIAGQELPIPAQIKENLGKPSLPIGKDFSGQNLKGRSFKDQDLTGANFSYADLQGANFTNARLMGANFSHVKTGLQRPWAFALMFCCFLLLILSITAASLLGSGWLALISLATQESQKYTTTITTGIVILVVFAVICISNIRKGWLSLLQRGLVLTLLLSPISLLIAILISFAFRTLTLPSRNNDWIIFINYIFFTIGLSLCSFWTIHKGVGKAWVASALAFVGSVFLTIGVGFGIDFAGSSLQRIQNGLSLVGVGIAISLGFAFAYFYQNHSLRSQRESRENGNRLSILGINFIWLRFPWLIAIIVAIALGVSQFFGKVDITIGLSLSGIALIWAFSLVYETARTRATLARMFGLDLLFSGIIAILVLGIVFVVTSNTATTSEQALILAIAVSTALIVAMFLILAGTANLSGAIAGIISVPIAVAVFYTLAWAAVIVNLPSKEIVTGIVFELAVLGIATALATAVTIAIGITITWVELGNRVIALIWGVVLALITLVLTVGTIVFSKASSLAISGTIVIGLATIQLGAYIAWQALAENVKFISVRNFALAFAGAGGTNFFNADLTDANFSQATLKCANFQQAKLKGTRWFQVNQLELASGSDSYLRYPSVQRLLISGNGQNQNFDGLDLRGINLRGANLADASFLNTDLSEADLQGANLSRAKLINTRLNGANLVIAQLTGVFIYNCELTPKTKLAGVECDYIYTKLPTNDNPDPGRKPEVNGRIFKPGELAEVLMILYSTQSIGHEGDRSIN
ncbi:MAG: pentapeptide repeat-containing protein [Nostoc sp.]|uniref:pentapeptide repeat-containing protein n=1 Tax=Nostoc sp. TaxID=1180 RepID=UPI002FF4B5D9